jgi:hypothetical protein
VSAATRNPRVKVLDRAPSFDREEAAVGSWRRGTSSERLWCCSSRQSLLTTMSSRSSNLGKGLSACDATSPSGVYEADAHITATSHLRRTEDRTTDSRRTLKRPHFHRVAPLRVHHGRHQDHHRPVLRTSACRMHARSPIHHAFANNIPLGSGDRLPPCHPLCRALQELPHAPRRRNLRYRAPSQLALRPRSKPR